MTASVPRALVYGIASRRCAVDAARSSGLAVLVADDAPTDAKRALAAELGTTLSSAPDGAELDALVAAADIVCPAPGVPETHPVIVLAALAAGARSARRSTSPTSGNRTGPAAHARCSRSRAPTARRPPRCSRPTCSTRPAIGPRRSATPRCRSSPPSTTDVDVFAVECSSFRLNWLRLVPRRGVGVAEPRARPSELAHLDGTYEAAKARMWAHRRPTDVAIGFVPTIRS